MAAFTFFRYGLLKAPNLNFNEYLSEQVVDNPENIFDVVFNKDLPLDLLVVKRTTNGKDVEVEQYKGEVLANRDGIIILTIENNKEKHTTIDKHDVTHPHNPYSYVVIDHRPGKNMIAVEKNAAFDQQPDKLLNVLSSSFNRLFSARGVNVEFYTLAKQFDDIWEAISTIRERTADRVKKISLDFSNNYKNKHKVDSNQAAQILTELAEKARAKGAFVLESNGVNELDVEAIRDDLMHIAEICLQQQEYDLIIQFFSYGVYRYGSEVNAQFGFDIDVLDAFSYGDDEMDFKDERSIVAHWMDNMSILFKDYEEQPFITASAKRRHRR